MAIHFQTLLSSSSGNVLMLWNERTRIMIDAGVRSQRQLRELLDLHGCDPCVDGILVSHLHGDHINYSSLRVIEQRQLPLHVHEENVDLLVEKHFKQKAFDGLVLDVYDDAPFRIGDFTIRTFETVHDGSSYSCGFVFECPNGAKKCKIAAVTDLCDWREVVPHIIDCDFLYVEANHDLDLLDLYPNWNSYNHLSNNSAGRLIRRVVDESRQPPHTVLVGHLSQMRNRPELALAAIRAILPKGKPYSAIDLCAAPPTLPSRIFRATRHD